jgi:uncharacterized protein YlxW (UPF0749 family)
MATLRDTLQAEINELQAQLTEKQNHFAQLQNSASSFLDQEATAIKEFVLNAWSHLFGSAPAPASDPATPTT